MRFVVPALVFLIIPAAWPQTLKTAQPVVSQSEDGPPLEGGMTFQPGESVFFSFLIENYKVGPTGKVQLKGHVQAFDPKGTPLDPPDEVAIGTTVGEEDKQWKPKLRSQIQIPPIAPAGKYRIAYDVADQQTQQTVSGEAFFPVSGRSVEPSEALVIRDVGFYRSQEDTTPLKVAAYSPGDTLWVRFDITGYKHGDQNAMDVSYDVEIFAGAGKRMFVQENAAVEKNQAFYPQPWVPAEFNVALLPNTSPGSYTLAITAHDAIGKQTAVANADFRVEK